MATATRFWELPAPWAWYCWRKLAGFLPKSSCQHTVSSPPSPSPSPSSSSSRTIGRHHFHHTYFLVEWRKPSHVWLLFGRDILMLVLLVSFWATLLLSFWGFGMIVYGVELFWMVFVHHVSNTYLCVPDWNTWLHGVELLARCSLQGTQLWSGICSFCSTEAHLFWSELFLYLWCVLSYRKTSDARLDGCRCLSCNSGDRAVVLSTVCPDAWGSWF